MTIPNLDPIHGNRQIGARELREMARRIRDMDRIGATNLDTLHTSCGPVLMAGAAASPNGDGALGFWAEITGGTQPYSWKEKDEITAGNFQDVVGGLSGTTTVNPAFEVNDNTGVAVGTIVRMWEGFVNANATGREYLFKHQVTTSDSALKYKRVNGSGLATEIPASGNSLNYGVPVEIGSIILPSAGFYLVSSSIDGICPKSAGSAAASVSLKADLYGSVAGAITYGTVLAWATTKPERGTAFLQGAIPGKALEKVSVRAYAKGLGALGGLTEAFSPGQPYAEMLHISYFRLPDSANEGATTAIGGGLLLN